MIGASKIASSAVTLLGLLAASAVVLVTAVACGSGGSGGQVYTPTATPAAATPRLPQGA